MPLPTRILITLLRDDIAPRFDLTTEVLMVVINEEGEIKDEKTVILPHSSAEELCHLILVENVNVLICGGIEDEFFQYLTWKKVAVIDSVIGPWRAALEGFLADRLHAGSILKDVKKVSKG